MSLEFVKKLLTQTESVRLEFKESYRKLPSNLFETICSFLNRDGGDILLGVNDDGEVTGIAPDKIDTLKTNIVNLSNNAQKIDPPFILFPQTIEIDGSLLIHIQVPQSSQVHKTANIIFDRSNDGDFRVATPEKIADIYNRKRNHFTEGMVYPYLTFGDFEQELFYKVRNLIRSKTPAHPWLSLSDEDMLLKAGMWKRDFSSGQEGYTLAAALLFGKEEVIQSILPHYKIDALVRRENMERYDDRLIIQTNLIEAYDQLISFTAKHLPDKFFMEGDIRVSLREKIFREVIANLIVHREYTNAFPATFTIYRDSVKVCNANNPHVRGPLHLDSFSPFPKNPYLSKFFIQLGRMEELGSGIINITKYLKKYVPGATQQFIDIDIFETIIPLIPEPEFGMKNKEGAQDEVQESLNGTERKILDYSEKHVWNRGELVHFLGLKSLSGHLKRAMKRLLSKGMLEYTLPDKIKSGNQKYRITDKGKRVLRANGG